MTPHGTFSSRIKITIETDKLISNGYIVVRFKDKIAGVDEDFEGGKIIGSSRDVPENKELGTLLGSNIGTTFALEIGKTPFRPGTPVHLVAFGEQVRVASVALFDE